MLGNAQTHCFGKETTIKSILAHSKYENDLATVGNMHV